MDRPSEPNHSPAEPGHAPALEERCRHLSRARDRAAAIARRIQPPCHWIRPPSHWVWPRPPPCTAQRCRHRHGSTRKRGWGMDPTWIWERWYRIMAYHRRRGAEPLLPAICVGEEGPADWGAREHRRTKPLPLGHRAAAASDTLFLGNSCGNALEFLLVHKSVFQPPHQGDTLALTCYNSCPSSKAG